DKAAVGCVGVVGHDAKIAILEGRYGLGQTRDELVVRIAPDKRFGDGGGNEARGRIVVEDGARLADKTDHHVTSRWRSRGARGDEANDDHEGERYRAARVQISAVRPVLWRIRPVRSRNRRPSDPKRSRKHRP